MAEIKKVKKNEPGYPKAGVKLGIAAAAAGMLIGLGGCSPIDVVDEVIDTIFDPSCACGKQVQYAGNIDYDGGMTYYDDGWDDVSDTDTSCTDISCTDASCTDCD